MSTCSNNDIINLLVEIEALREGTDIQVDVPLKQLGVQSLDKFNLFLLIEERFGVEVSDEDLAELNTISSISAYVQARAGGGAA